MQLAILTIRRELHGFLFLCIHVFCFYNNGALLNLIQHKTKMRLVCNLEVAPIWKGQECSLENFDQTPDLDWLELSWTRERYHSDLKRKRVDYQPLFKKGV